MPLDLGHYPAKPAPTLGLVVEPKDFYLKYRFLAIGDGFETVIYLSH
jgi:hypothetical protein